MCKIWIILASAVPEIIGAAKFTRNPSWNEIANVNLLRDITHVLQNTKNKPTSFSKLDDS